MKPWHIIHSHGAQEVVAPDAKTAVRMAFVPDGYRDVFAVVDASIVIYGDRSDGPFTAAIATAAVPVEGAHR